MQNSNIIFSLVPHNFKVDLTEFWQCYQE